MIAAKREGWPTVVVPADNLAEAVLVDGIEIRGATTLRQVQCLAQRRGRFESGHSHGPVRHRWRAGSRRRGGATTGPFRCRGSRCGRAPSDADGTAGHRQNDVGSTSSGTTTSANRGRVAGGDRHSLGRRVADGRDTFDQAAAVGRAAPHRQRGGTGRRRESGGPGRVRSVALTAVCCSWTSVPRSERRRWRRCVLRWRKVKFGSPAGMALPSTQRAFSWCSLRTRVPARPPIRETASARGPSSVATWASCRVRCWTGSTFGCRCFRCDPVH